MHANPSIPTTDPREGSGAPERAPVVRISAGARPDPTLAERRRRDRELVDAILAGDSASFARLHALYAKRLHRFAAKRLGDPTEAEDVVQDVFLEIHRCLASWEGRSALLTWMFGITHHQICRRFRRKALAVTSLDQLDASPPIAPEVPIERHLDSKQALAICAEALDREVTTAQHEIFDLHYGEQRAIKEIAEELGKSNQAVKISLFRTRRVMEARLEEHGLCLSA